MSSDAICQIFVIEQGSDKYSCFKKKKLLKPLTGWKLLEISKVQEHRAKRDCYLFQANGITAPDSVCAWCVRVYVGADQAKKATKVGKEPPLKNRMGKHNNH